uniref:Uncharacterized protein n=1 Tax=Cacopsylla melanoneura TaxID=428564 RepID=A0A8D8WIG6_9HEMI
MHTMEDILNKDIIPANPSLTLTCPSTSPPNITTRVLTACNMSQGICPPSKSRHNTSRLCIRTRTSLRITSMLIYSSQTIGVPRLSDNNTDNRYSILTSREDTRTRINNTTLTKLVRITKAR